MATLSEAFVIHSVAHQDEPINTWEKFKSTFNKTYHSAEEEATRKANFEHSLAWVRENNGLKNMTYAINELSDLSEKEFFALNGVPSTKPPGEEYYNFVRLNVDPNLPRSIDWRQYFGPIENQGQCGSCWSFAASAVVEALGRIKHGRWDQLSKQELIDCTNQQLHPDYANLGCRGGHIIEAFRYVHEHGLSTNAQYPYQMAVGNCRAGVTTRDPLAKVASFFQLVPGATSDAEMMTALKSYGPIGVTIHASFREFMYYRGDTIMNYFPNGSPQLNDHAIVLVGYGTTSQGYDYWIIRNSHGVSWGDHGYGYMLRGQNTMGINNNVNIAIAP